MDHLQHVQWHLDRAAKEVTAAERSTQDVAARAHSKLAFLHNVRALELSASLSAPVLSES